MVISGHQWSSEVISGHQRSSEVISGSLEVEAHHLGAHRPGRHEHRRVDVGRIWTHAVGVDALW